MRGGDVEGVELAGAQGREVLGAAMKRSSSSSATIPAASVRSLVTYCSRANGRAPSGWASATAISSVITVPSVRVISTDPPKAFSLMSREW